VYHVLPMYRVYIEERIKLSASECLLPYCLKPLSYVWDAFNAFTRRVVGRIAQSV